MPAGCQFDGASVTMLSQTALVTPITPCLAAEYPVVPAPAWIEFTDAQLTMEPCCGTRPSSLRILSRVSGIARY
jgi:hypothetical protein